MDSLGPLDCFQIADDLNIASTSAVELCAGATSAAPGRCLQAAMEGGSLSTLQAIQLCQGATSNAPVACLEQLTDVGTLTNNQMIDYCGMPCAPDVPPPGAGNPECLEAALDRSNLSEQQGEALCTLATSAGPVDCFVAADNGTDLSDSQLIQLCAETPSCQSMYAPPPY